MDPISAKSKLILLLALRTRRSRRWWVRPIFERRLQQGDADNLIEEMRLNDIDSFFNYFRMTPHQFDELLSLVGPSIQKENTNYRQSIPEKDRLAVTLRFLASGDLMTSLSFAFRMGKSTVSLIIRETCAALCNVLQPTVLDIPNKEKWLHIAEEYEALWQFPHCLGAIDGKHVIIQAPPRSGSLYFNYKGSFSIVLMAVADAKYKFIIVDIGAAGHQSDGGIFINSTFGKALDEEGLNLPESSSVCGKLLPYTFVGDEAFPLKRNLMRPYPGRKLDTEKSIFNYRLSRARRCIENAFGIMAARFRILRKPIVAGLTTSQNIVKATVCLHNYLRGKEEQIPAKERRYCPPGFADSDDGSGSIVMGRWREETLQNLSEVTRSASNMYSINAAAVRTSYTDYFINEGAVPWQYAAVSQK